MINIEKIVSCIDSHNNKIIMRREKTKSFIDKLKQSGFKEDTAVEIYEVDPTINTKNKPIIILSYRFICLAIYSDIVYLGYYKEPKKVYFEKYFAVDSEIDITNTIIVFINNTMNKAYIE